jgi:geranylgeranyl reductase family protein
MFAIKNMVETDICIIGAGPAGATTSLFLSKFKIKHVIVDAQSFPRDKVCGDALDLKVVRVLNTLDPNFVNQHIHNNANFTQCNQLILHLDNQSPVTFNNSNPINNQPYFIVGKRSCFDNLLVQKIDANYATFLQATKLVKIESSNNKQQLYFNSNGKEVIVNTNIVVGADGVKSAVLKHFASKKIDRHHFAAGLRQYWQGVKSAGQPDAIAFYLPKALPGAYFWIFYLPNGQANVGCGLASHVVSAKKINLTEVFNDIIKNDPVISPLFTDASPLESPVGWGLPLASARRNAFGHGWLLVGDAASLICPTTGEGIGPAMLSGYFAALALQKAHLKNDFSEASFSNYTSNIYKYLNNQISIYTWVNRISPFVFNFCINNFASSKLFKWHFKKNLSKWINTAYNKPYTANG